LSLEQRKSNEFFDASFINHTCTGEEDLPQPIKSLYERLIELAARPIESYDAPGPATLHYREHLATCSASELDAADVFLQAQQVLRKRDTRSARDMVCRARELWGSDEPLLERALETIDRAMA
jgi:hypothetical protein